MFLQKKGPLVGKGGVLIIGDLGDGGGGLIYLAGGAKNAFLTLLHLNLL